MSLSKECTMIIFVSLYSIAVLIIIGVPVDKSVALGVASVTKIILGVTTVVIHDMVFLEGAAAPFYLFGFCIINYNIN